MNVFSCSGWFEGHIYMHKLKVFAILNSLNLAEAEIFSHGNYYNTIKYQFFIVTKFKIILCRKVVSFKTFNDPDHFLNKIKNYGSIPQFYLVTENDVVN